MVRVPPDFESKRPEAQVVGSPEQLRRGFFEVLVRHEHDQVPGVGDHPITPVANSTFMSTDSRQSRRMG